MKLHRYEDTVVVTGATHEKGDREWETVFASRPVHRHLHQEGGHGCASPVR